MTHDALKVFLKRRMTQDQIVSFKRAVRTIYATIYQNDLRKLGQFFETDKAGPHNFVSHYEQHFGSRRLNRMNILEIGVGGEDNSHAGGCSLRMWKSYFPRSHIYAIDIHDKSPLQEDRITIFQGSQDDESFLRDVVERIGRLDIIIDDGSHVSSHIIKTFNILFPLLEPGGYYVIEDLETSYKPHYGGNRNDLNDPKTSVNMLKRFVDGLNHESYAKPGETPSYTDEHVFSIHFYNNVAFIQKSLSKNGD